MPSFEAIRLKAVVLRAYFGVALCALTPVARPGLGTYACDMYGRIYYDPTLDWTVEESAWALIHELNHWIRSHFARSQPHLAAAIEARSVRCLACELEIINNMQDAEINDDIEDEGGRLPNHESRIFPKTFGFAKGKFWEEYYQEFTARRNGSGAHRHRQVLCGSAAHGMPQSYEAPYTGPDSKVPGFNQYEADLIRDAVAREILSAKSAGNVPQGLVRWADQRLTPPQVRWERELLAMVQSSLQLAAGAVDYSYRRYNPRSASFGVMLPRLVRPVVDLAVVLDTSGSMDGRSEIPLALSEIPGIARALGQRSVPVICCDSGAAPAQLVTHVQNLKLYGGGGTDMGAGIEAARSRGAKVVIVLTDGYTPWPDQPPRGMRVVVALVGANADRGSVPAYARSVVRIVAPGDEAEADSDDDHADP